MKTILSIFLICGFFLAGGFAKYDGHGKDNYTVYDDKGNQTGRIRKNHINGDFYLYDNKGKVKGRIHWNPVVNRYEIEKGE